MAAFTSKASGNWAATGQTTWNQTGSPASGDTVTIQSPHNVTVAAPAAGGTSPADQTTAAVTVNNGGTLTVNAPLAVMGNLFCNGTVAVNAGGGIEFDSSGDLQGTHTSYVLQTTYGSKFYVNGTSRAATAYVRSKTGGGNANFTSVGSIFDLVLSYGVFTRLGSTSAAGLVFQGITPDSGAGQRMLVTGCKFDTCGTLRFIEVRQDVRFEVTGCTWVNSFVNPAFTNNGIPGCFSTGGDAPTTGTRLFTDNSLDLGGFWALPQGWTVDRNVFGMPPIGPSAAAPWASFDLNVVYKSVNLETQTVGPVSNSYWVNDAAALQGHLHTSSFGDTLLHGNVFHWLGSGDCPANCISTTEEGTVSRTITARNNISVPSATGGSSGTMMDAFNNSSQGFTVTSACEHNTIALGATAGTGVGSAFALISTVAPERSNQCSSFRGNLIYRTGAAPGTGVFAVGNYAGYTPVVDALSAANCDYNAYCALDAVASGFWSGISGDTNHEAGTPYNSPMSGTTAPGLHDVALGAASSVKTAGPRFVDPTRNLLTFDSHMGGNGTLPHALAALAAQNDTTNPNYISGYTNAAMIAWVKAGFVPTNSALRPYLGTGDGTQAYPSDPTTLDAAGNPMGATIGAMAFQASGGPYPFFTDNSLTGGFSPMGL